MLTTPTLLPLAIFEGVGGGGQGGPQSTGFFIGWLVLMVGIFYFLMIRPQQRREKDRRALISNIKTGDRVVFCAGFVGVIANVKDHVFVIKIADSTKVEVLKGAVTRVLQKDEELTSEVKE